MTKAEAQAALNVSRETLERLEAYVDLLLKWSRAINLVGATDLDHLWTRHILDSAQIVPQAPSDATSWLDVGSGAGLPALVCRIILQGQGIDIPMSLVEADQRKSAFLRETNRQLGTDVKIHSIRLERLPALPCDIITARAVAPLPRLLQLCAPFVHDDTVCLFLKGQNVEEEIGSANLDWQFRVDRISSVTDPAASLLRITNIRRL
ncbi:MAG: 16S rRNA (guanine(527)-N(7))-methyltransferase RsmG [Pseudomonadota bacterium]